MNSISDQSNSTGRSSESSKKVLIVDDEPDILEILKFYLQSYDFEVLTATNAENALEIISKTDLLFCITDLDMPKINGVDLINSIRIMKPTLPTCICSAKVTDFASDITRIAVSTTLPKPFFKEDLGHCIRELKERAKMYEELAAPNISSHVEEVMSKKVVSTDCTTSCKNIIQMMKEHEIGSIVILDEDTNKLIGIFTDRDVVNALCEQNTHFLDLPISHLMNKNVVTIDPTTNVEEALAKMEKFKIKHLPVVKDDIVIGIVSIRDLITSKVRTFQNVLKNQVELLKKYHIANKSTN